MANIFVSALTGDDGDNGSTEALAKATLVGALAIHSDGDVIWFKNDAILEVTATSNATTDGIDIVGYETFAGSETKPWESDLSQGGSQYKQSWSIVNSDGTAFHTLTVAAGVDRFRLYNIKITGTASTQEPISFDQAGDETFGLVLNNCWIDGGKTLVLIKQWGLFITDCQITGGWDLTSPKSFNGCFDNVVSGQITGNYFNISAGNGYIALAASGLGGGFEPAGAVISHNIFTCGASAALDKEFVRTHHGGKFFNNTFYLPAGASLGVGAGGAENSMLALSGIASSLPSAAWNNIFVSDRTTSKPEGISDLNSNMEYEDYNCFDNTLQDSITPQLHDIIIAAQLANPANGDFRLKPISPCLNTGKPTIGGQSIGLNGFSTMGAWQRTSKLIHRRQ